MTSQNAPTRVPGLPFELPSPEEVTRASEAVVKTRKLSYGKKGILVLAGNRLLFGTGDPKTSWELAASAITDVKRPWYGMGSYLTFKANGKAYAIAFRDANDINALVSGSYLSARFGGTAGAGLGMAGDAVVVAKMVQGATLAADWASVLGAPEAATAAEAEWQAQQTRSPDPDK
jgi:hypothetical protein